jgi:hypothetical protein
VRRKKDGRKKSYEREKGNRVRKETEGRETEVP